MERIADVFVTHTASSARKRAAWSRGVASTGVKRGAAARRIIRPFLALLTGVIVLPMSARAVLQDVIRADDGTAYEVLRADLAPVRVIMVSAATGGQTDCNGFTPGGGFVVADGAVAANGQTLVPYNTVTRSEVFTPNDINTLAFDQHFGGRVTLGSGGGVVNVCASAFDCSGQTNPHTTVALSSTTGGVPAACIDNSVSASCYPNPFSVFGFGLSASGSPPICNTSPTVQTNSQCAAVPGDGFTLNAGQAIVIAFGNLAGSGLGASFAGFDIGTNGCSANQVGGDEEGSISEPANAPPTATPGPRCGDGTVNQPSEQCDHGVWNGTAGACCSATCTFKAAGSACTDGNVCTSGDECDGAGHCTAGACAVGTSCTDFCGGHTTCQISNGNCKCP